MHRQSDLRETNSKIDMLTSALSDVKADLATAKHSLSTIQDSKVWYCMVWYSYIFILVGKQSEYILSTALRIIHLLSRLNVKARLQKTKFELFTLLTTYNLEKIRSHTWYGCMHVCMCILFARYVLLLLSTRSIYPVISIIRYHGINP